MLFRKATKDDIPELVECRIRQLIDEGQTPDIDILEPEAAVEEIIFGGVNVQGDR